MAMIFAGRESLRTSSANILGVRCLAICAQFVHGIREGRFQENRVHLGQCIGTAPQLLRGTGVDRQDDGRIALFEEEAHRRHDMIYRDGSYAHARDFQGPAGFQCRKVEERLRVQLGMDQVGPQAIIEDVAAETVQHGLAAVDRYPSSGKLLACFPGKRAASPGDRCEYATAPHA